MEVEHAFVASGFLNIEMYERHEPWWGIHSVPAWVHEILQPLNTSPEWSRLCLHNRGRNCGPLMSPSYEVLEWNRDFWLQDQDSRPCTPAALSRKWIRLSRPIRHQLLLQCPPPSSLEETQCVTHNPGSDLSQGLWPNSHPITCIFVRLISVSIPHNATPKAALWSAH